MPPRSASPYVHDDYTIACICPMGIELAPVLAMLDETHPTLRTRRDQNAYTLGKMKRHNVVVVVMPEIGNNAAATVALQLLNDFPSIRFGLLVGIGGGVPGGSKNDIRLGDVVVSKPTNTFGGVVQYDLGKRMADGSFKRTGTLNKPPPLLSSSVQKLKGKHYMEGSRICHYLGAMVEHFPQMRRRYSRPTEPDLLFVPSYSHVKYQKTCGSCDPRQLVSRYERDEDRPYIHYGTIASANSVLRNAADREALRRDMNVLCVEMEAAGIMNDFPCLVIRGICDYADSHKNKIWQPYAAAAAAAYMKELLSIIPTKGVSTTETVVHSSRVEPSRMPALSHRHRDYHERLRLSLGHNFDHGADDNGDDCDDDDQTIPRSSSASRGLQQPLRSFHDRALTERELPSREASRTWANSNARRHKSGSQVSDCALRPTLQSVPRRDVQAARRVETSLVHSPSRAPGSTTSTSRPLPYGKGTRYRSDDGALRQLHCSEHGNAESSRQIMQRSPSSSSTFTTMTEDGSPHDIVADVARQTPTMYRHREDQDENEDLRLVFPALFAGPPSLFSPVNSPLQATATPTIPNQCRSRLLD